MVPVSIRSGFVALAGRPNVGKSTLVNAMVGHKVAIVSDKPQTTRRAIRGVLTVPDRFQLVLTDLPGVQRPRDELTSRMQRRVESELAESDAALFVVNGEQGVGPGDRFIAEALAGAGVPVVIAVNKVDAMRHDGVVAALQAADDLGLDAEVFPVSARTVTSPSRCSISSIWTSTACGTSWRVRRSTCSRTSSARTTCSGWSETSPRGK